MRLLIIVSLLFITAEASALEVLVRKSDNKIVVIKEDGAVWGSQESNGVDFAIVTMEDEVLQKIVDEKGTLTDPYMTEEGTYKAVKIDGVVTRVKTVTGYTESYRLDWKKAENKIVKKTDTTVFYLSGE